MKAKVLSLVLIAAVVVGLTGQFVVTIGRAEARDPILDRSKIRIVVVSHCDTVDPFCVKMYNGFRQAGKDLGITVEINVPPKFDIVQMAQLIDAAVASKPDGLIVSLPDPEALASSVKAAIAAGIPVASFNSGYGQKVIPGIMVHVGQGEYMAGYLAAKKMAEAGAKDVLCLNQSVGNKALDERCNGMSDAMKEANGKSTVLGVNYDPTETQNRVYAALTADPAADGLWAAQAIIIPCVKAVEQADRKGKVLVTSADVNPEVMDLIKSGDVLFGTDQQPYLQGYLPTVWLTLYLTNLNTPVDLNVNTGPGFIVKDNVDQVMALVAKGTR